MKRLLMLSVVLLTAAVAKAEVGWNAVLVRNQDSSTAEQVVLSTDTTRLNLEPLPVKAEIEPVRTVAATDGVNLEARLITVEFLDGSGAATGTFCLSDTPKGQGNSTELMVRRYNTLYQIIIQC